MSNSVHIQFVFIFNVLIASVAWPEFQIVGGGDEVKEYIGATSLTLAWNGSPKAMHAVGDKELMIL